MRDDVVVFECCGVSGGVSGVSGDVCSMRRVVCVMMRRVREWRCEG